MIRHLQTFKEKIGKIKAEAVGTELTSWEKERLKEWEELSCGSQKQNAIVDKIGARVMGEELWADFMDEKNNYKTSSI